MSLLFFSMTSRMASLLYVYTVLGVQLRPHADVYPIKTSGKQGWGW